MTSLFPRYRNGNGISSNLFEFLVLAFIINVMCLATVCQRQQCAFLTIQTLSTKDHNLAILFLVLLFLDYYDVFFTLGSQEKQII